METQRRAAYGSLAHRVFAMSRALWDDGGTDEGRGHGGNICVPLEHAEHARDQHTEVLLTFHHEQTSPVMAKPLIRRG